MNIREAKIEKQAIVDEATEILDHLSEEVGDLVRKKYAGKSGGLYHFLHLYWYENYYNATPEKRREMDEKYPMFRGTIERYKNLGARSEKVEEILGTDCWWKNDD